MTDPEPSETEAAAEPPKSALRELLAECIDAIAAGGPDAAEPLLARHREHEAALRQRLMKLRQAGLLEAGDADQDRIPERLGGFRLLRRIGSGGMGVVYLAVQEALGREVALKLVRPEQLYFPGARQRFEREVDAIARLNDPGIVPIYTVGEEGGIPFFAMEHVVGASLVDVIADAEDRRPEELTGRDFARLAAARAGGPPPEPLPATFGGNWVRTCCRIVARMAWAVEHAHERGVLHRDLKPSNAMVTPAGRVLLLDFGLASADGSSRLTRSGAVLGTLHYSAPEQLLGEDVDLRTDVYSLGVTLYELLALRAPFDAASAEPLRRAILAGAPPPLERHNPAAPRDVATICRKAMDRDPGRRYASARAFAEDLEAFLDHRSIAARPAGPLLRSRRFLRRHPAWSTAVGLCLASAVTVAALLASSAATRSAARASLDHALHAIERLLDQARDPRLVATPGLDALRESQLEDAVRMLDELDRAQHDDDVRLLLAQGRLQAAELLALLGRIGPSSDAIAQAEALLVELDDRRPGDRRLAILLGTAASMRGANARDEGDLDGAEVAWRDGIARLEPLVAGGLRERQALRSLGGCLTNLAILRQHRGALDEAEALLQRSLAVTALRTAAEPDLTAMLDEARTRMNLANVLRDQRRLDESRAEFERVVERIAASGSADPEARRELARARFGAARAAQLAGDAAAAAAGFAEALAGFGQLADDFPDRARYHWERGMAEMEWAGIAERAGDLATAERLYRASLAHHDELVARFPALRDASAQLAAVCGSLAVMLERQGRDGEAEPLMRRAVALFEQRAGRDQSGARWREQLAHARINFGYFLLRSGRAEESLAQLRLAVADLDRVGRVAPQLPNALRLCAYAATACDDSGAAIEALVRYAELAKPARAELARIGADLHLGDDERFVRLLEGLDARR